MPVTIPVSFVCMLAFSQEIRHDAVELYGLLHMGMVSRSRNPYLIRSGYALLQHVSNLKGFWRVDIAYHNQRRHFDLSKSMDSGRFEREHVLLMRQEITMLMDVSRGNVRDARACLRIDLFGPSPGPIGPEAHRGFHRARDILALQPR